MKHNRDTLSLPVDTCERAGRRRQDGGHSTAVGAHRRGRNVAEDAVVDVVGAVVEVKGAATTTRAVAQRLPPPVCVVPRQLKMPSTKVHVLGENK